MSERKSGREYLVLVVSWCALGVTLAQWWHLLLEPAFREGYFNADALAVVTLFEDTTRWGGRLQDWALTPAPYFFPDLALYAVARLGGGSIEGSQYFAGLIQVPLFAWGLQRVVRALEPGALSSRAAALSVAVCVSLFLTGRTGLVEQVIYPVYHGGVVVLGIWCMALVVEAEQRWSRLRFATLLLLSVLGGLSDGLWAVGWAAGALVVGVVSLLRREGSAVARATLIAGVLGAGGQLLTRRLLPEQQQQTLLRLGGAGRSLVALLEDVSRHPIPLAVIVLGALWSAVTLTRGAGTVAQRRYALFIVAGLLSTLAAAAITGNAASRYLVWVFFCCLPIPLLLMAAAERRFQASTAVALVTAVVFVAAVVTPRAWGALSPGLRTAWEWRQPAACVEALARRRGWDSAVSEYWSAKPLTVFSDGRLRVLQVNAQLTGPHLWITDKRWYCAPHSTGVLIENGLSKSALEALPLPDSTAQCGRSCSGSTTRGTWARPCSTPPVRSRGPAPRLAEDLVGAALAPEGHRAALKSLAEGACLET